MTKDKELNYKFHIDHFATYGLNKLRNFLSPPRCPDCGEPGTLCFENEQDVYEFCTDLLVEHGCDSSAIFLLFADGSQRVALYMPEDEEDAVVSVIGSSDHYFFAEVDAECRLCCYGMMIEVEPGHWEICD